MSDWCQRHSEDKKWYLNVKNFSKEFSKGEAMVEALNAYFQNIESIVETSPPLNVEMLNLNSDDPFLRNGQDHEARIQHFSARAEFGKIYRMFDWHSSSSSFKQDTGRQCV